MKKLILISILMLAAGPNLRAGEGRIPIWQPVVIGAPGSYVVTQDITAASGPILDVRIGGVSVDLNGHTITVSNMADPVVKISSVMGIDPHPFRIANGAIVGGMYGIQALNTVPRTLSLADLGITGASTAAVKVDHLGDLEATGIVVVDTKTAFDMTGPSPTPDGQRPAALIRASILHADVGVVCDGVTCGVMNSAITSCGTGIRLMAAEGSRVSGNSFDVPGGDVCFNPQPEPPGDTIHIQGSPGVHVTGNTLRGWSASTGANHGITGDDMSGNALIVDNLISGYGDDGIHTSSHHGLFRSNGIGGNGGNGIWLSGNYCLVDDNRIGGNMGDGIVFNGPVNIFRGNVLLGNANPLSGISLSDSVDGGGNIQ